MDRARAVRWVAVGIGAFLLAFGVWAFASPATFYERMATFPPYNRHLIRDIGVFQSGLGVAMLVTALWTDALLVALVGTSAAFTLHFFSHVIDRELGGRSSDPFSFGLLLIVVAMATVWRAREVGRFTPVAGKVPGVPPSEVPDDVPRGD